MSAELPNGWVLTTLETIAHWGSGGTPSRSKPELYGGTIPWFKTGELGPKEIFNSEETITHEALKASSAKLFPQGSVVVAMYGATIGKVSILGREAATNQACAVGIPMAEATSSGYLYNYLRSQKEAFVAAGQGGAQPNISQTVIKAWPIPIAPVPEQKRIAYKLDTVLTRVDAVNTRLARVAPILKRFRQSVLSAATSGRLTEDWRIALDQFSDVPTKALGETAFITKLAGFEYTKYVTYQDDGDLRVIKAENVGKDGFKPTMFSRVRRDTVSSLTRSMVYPGDLLMVFVGAGTGQVASVPEGSDWFLGPNVALVRCNPEHLIGAYGEIYLRSPAGQREVLKFTKSTAQPSLSMTSIRQFRVSLPSIPEQIEIVRRVETLFAFADRLEARLQTAKTATERLTPALLAKAFRGELVPQDPNDEPASELLRRLQQEAPSTSAKRGRKSAA